MTSNFQSAEQGRLDGAECHQGLRGGKGGARILTFRVATFADINNTTTAFNFASAPFPRTVSLVESVQDGASTGK